MLLGLMGWSHGVGSSGTSIANLHLLTSLPSPQRSYVCFFQFLGGDVQEHEFQNGRRVSSGVTYLKLEGSRTPAPPMKVPLFTASSIPQISIARRTKPLSPNPISCPG